MVLIQHITLKNIIKKKNKKKKNFYSFVIVANLAPWHGIDKVFLSLSESKKI